jgi:hypothetical protein
VPFSLTYNSQNWREDPGGTWQLGADIGYGYGWKLQAGSLIPCWSSYWTLDHYEFIDGSGAEYRLDQNSGGVWSSKQSVYVSYDSNTGRLWFKNGTFWLFGSTSAATEQDAGTLYPTSMTDRNGNYILVDYYPGAGQTGDNTSGRIRYIEDVRAVNDSGVYRTYKFTYDGTNHLTGITNLIGTAEGYTFAYSAQQTLYSPFSSTTFGQTQVLTSATVTGLGTSYSFVQDATGALTKVTLPYGGYLSWQFTNYTYSGSRLQPEVQNRYLSPSGSTADLSRSGRFGQDGPQLC